MRGRTEGREETGIGSDSDGGGGGDDGGETG